MQTYRFSDTETIEKHIKYGVTMTKKDFVRLLVDKTRKSIMEENFRDPYKTLISTEWVVQSNVQRVLDAASELIPDIILKDGRFEIPKVGVLRVRQTKERRSFNPRSKEHITVPKRKRISFWASTKLRKRLRHVDD